MRILINRSDAIGDTLLTLPLAQMIKEHFPLAKVYFLISPRCQDLFLHNPHVDEVITLPSELNFFERFSFLKEKYQELKIDHYIYAGGQHNPSWVAWSLGVPFRGGNLNKIWGFLFLNKGLRQKRSMVEMHEAEYNMQLLGPLGLQYHYTHKDRYFPQIYLQQDEIEAGQDYLHQVFQEQNIPLRERYIIIHPGMSGHTLNWSSRNYARFILQLEKRLPNRVSYVVSYTPSDMPYLKGLQQELNLPENAHALKNVCFLDGQKRGLRTYMAVLSQAAAFLGPSTGTTHLAAALKVPLMALYSPIKVQSSMRWGPFVPKEGQARVQLVVPDVVCGETFKCAGQTCPYYECMGQVEVAKVVDLALQYINGHKDRNQSGN